MTKKNKTIIIASSLLAGLTTVGIATPLLYINGKNSQVSDGLEYYNAQNEANIRNNPLNNEHYFVYENKRFYTLDDMAEYFINKYNALDSDYYIGDPYDSITDQENKIVDITKMRKYIKNRIFPAYKNAIGAYDYNYNQVKKSYINPALVKYKYDDFNGNIFNTYSDAKKSILASENNNPIMYYQLSNGMKYNPLSKNDLNLFKNDIFDNLNKMYRNPNNINYNTKSNLEVKIYDKTGTTAEPVYTSAGSDVLSKSNLIKSIVQEAIMDYYNIKYEILNNQLSTKFNVKLNIKEYGNGSKCQYIFKNVRGKPYMMGGKSLVFENVAYKDLGKFAAFTNKNIFFDNERNHTNPELPNMSLSIKKYWTNKLARELKVWNLLDSSFEVEYIGTDVGGDDGVDIDIMQEGTEKPAHFIAFEVEFENTNNNFNSMIKNKYDNKIASMQKKYGANTLLSKLNNYIYNRVFDIVNKEWNNAPRKIAVEDFINIKNRPNIAQNEYDFKHKRAKKFTPDTTKFAPNSLDAILRNNFMIDDVSKCDFVDLNTTTILWDFIINNKEEVVKLLTNSDYKYIVEYNQKPLFEVDGIINTVNVNNLYDFSFINNIANYFNNDWNKSKFENWKNVSQHFTLSKGLDGSKVKTINKTSKNYFRWDSKYNLEFVQKGNDPIYPEGLQAPSLDDQNTLDAYKINSIQHVYQTQLSKINTLPNWQSQLEKEFNKPEDILFLYTRNNDILQPELLSYREYIDNGFNKNVSLYNNQYLKLFSTKASIEAIKANKAYLEPSKVVVLYDLLGNIVNPGVRLTEDQAFQTTNDAVYDSEDVIIENLLRTKLIPIDQNKVFYQEENFDKYTLIDKRINQVYRLNIDNKNTYFISFANALSYLKDYLRINAIKIAY